jgi:hypothetical protein
MIFGSPSFDLQIVLILLAIALVISMASAIFARRKFITLIMVFSILANSVILLGVFNGSQIFRFYNILWLSYFSFFIWPIINIIFIVYYAKTNFINNQKRK